MASRTSITFVVIAAVLSVAVAAEAQQPTRNTYAPRQPGPTVVGRFNAVLGDAVIPMDFFIERPTLKCAGFEWYVSGDDNHDAVVTVQFREKGTSSWREGLPLLRIQREKIWGHELRWLYEAPNMFAGSIFGLEPATTYECRFTMSDPDGVANDAEKTVLVTTRPVPKPCEDGYVYHVYPTKYEGPREELA